MFVFLRIFFIFANKSIILLTLLNPHAMKKLLFILVALLATTSVCAEDFVNGVVLIGGTKSETNYLKSELIADGWILVDYDLNKGCGTGSDYIFLLYTKGSNETHDAGWFATDFYIRSSSSSSTPDQITHNGRTYTLVEYVGGSHFESSKGDLNSNAGGTYIHLYVATDDKENYRSTAIKSISFNSNSSGAVGENGGNSPADLNEGCGSESDYIYMHTSSAQKGWTMSENVSGSECQITGYAGVKNNKTCLTIPLTIDNVTVASCSNSLFNGFTNLDTLMMYDNGAIRTMPSMQGCSSLKHVHSWISNTSYYLDQLPSSIRNIPEYAFVGTNVTELRSNYVYSVGKHAFEGCNLSWIRFNYPELYINEYAFANYGSHQCIVYCGSIDMESVWTPKVSMYSPLVLFMQTNNNWYCGWCGGYDQESNNHLYWTLKNNHLKINCADDIWVQYPGKQIIKTHNWYSDAIQMSIDTITLNHVDTIGGGVFRDIDALQLVDIQSGARYISSNSFRDCDNLKTVNLPSTVERINTYAFYDCPLLTDIYFNGTQQQWNSVSKAALWKPNATKEHWHCTVTFNANGHGTAPDPQYIEWSNQDKASEPTAPTANGYNFKGWYTSAACVTQWNFNNIVTGDMTLYAKWEQATSPIGDVNGDGQVTSADITCIYNYLLNGDQTFVATSDGNGDGSVTSADITIIYNILLGN